MENLSASYVPGLESDRDAGIMSFLDWSNDSATRFIYMAATYYRKHEDRRYRNRATFVCMGTNPEGLRDILSTGL